MVQSEEQPKASPELEPVPKAPAEAAEAAPAESAPAVPDAAAIETLAKERDQYLEMARRVRADFENYQKRIARERQAEALYAPQSFVVDLLPVLDNLDRALESTKCQPDIDTLVRGVDLVRKQFADALTKHGVESIRPERESFDPNVHEAVMQEPTSEYPPMTVLQVVRTGYRLHERVIRPAQVVVAGPPRTAAPPQDGEKPPGVS
jgi:molecular chaperone GrpE